MFPNKKLFLLYDFFTMLEIVEISRSSKPEFKTWETFENLKCFYCYISCPDSNQVTITII